MHQGACRRWALSGARATRDLEARGQTARRGGGEDVGWLPGAVGAVRRHAGPQPLDRAHDCRGLLLLDEVPCSRGRVEREAALRLREQAPLLIRDTAVVPGGADEQPHRAADLDEVGREPLRLPGARHAQIRLERGVQIPRRAAVYR